MLTCVILALSLSVPSYATSADVCLVFINALSGEGADRTELYNPDQDDFITTVATECNNTVCNSHMSSLVSFSKLVSPPVTHSPDTIYFYQLTPISRL